MISKIQSFMSSDGAAHLTLADAQKVEVNLILADMLKPVADDPCAQCLPAFAAAVVDAQERIIDVLTTRPSSRPKQRKVNGFVAKRGRKPTAKPSSAQPEATTAAG